MTAAEHKIRKQRFARIRLVKKLLRPLPRRATIHKYPILKIFAQTARKNSFLWSFRTPEVIPALYAGWILALLPIYGIQVFLAFFLALGLRSNLMILVGLQFVTNPFTIVPLYWVEFHLGNFFLGSFSIYKEIDFNVFKAFLQGSGALSGGFYFFKATCLGGIIIGYFAAFISSFLYQLMAKRATENYTVVVAHPKQIDEAKKSSAQEHCHDPMANPATIHEKRAI